MSKVVVYTTPVCPYCVRAKRLLGHKNISYEEIDVSRNVELREEMTRRAGGRHAVPQIFIGDVHVGGWEELYALDRTGKLDPILATS